MDADEEVWLHQVVASSDSGTPSPPDWLHASLVLVWPALYHLMTLPSFQGMLFNTWVLVSEIYCLSYLLANLPAI